MIVQVCDDCPFWKQGKCDNHRSAYYQVSLPKPREICLRRRLDLDEEQKAGAKRAPAPQPRLW